MKKSAVDSAAFSVSLDKGIPSLEILYKGVPIQVITFGTSGPSDVSIAVNRLADAERVGAEVVYGFKEEDPLPIHIIAKALIVEEEGQDMILPKRNKWKGNLYNVESPRIRQSLTGTLTNAKRNYGWYQS